MGRTDHDLFNRDFERLKRRQRLDTVLVDFVRHLTDSAEEGDVRYAIRTIMNSINQVRSSIRQLIKLSFSYYSEDFFMISFSDFITDFLKCPLIIPFNIPKVIQYILYLKIIIEITPEILTVIPPMILLDISQKCSFFQLFM